MTGSDDVPAVACDEQRPRLVGVTSDSVTVQWTVCDTQGTAVSPDAAMQLEREPAGGQAEMSGKGAGEEHCHPWAGRTCIELNKDAGSSDSSKTAEELMSVRAVVAVSAS